MAEHAHGPFDPFNSRNKEISLKAMQKFLSSYGIKDTIRNPTLYRRAFIHRSYTKRELPDDCMLAPCPAGVMPLKSASNERLEFIGDGILELVTKYYLYRRFKKADEGFMTEKKIALVKNEHIGQLAKDIGLDKWFVLSKQQEEKNTRHNLKKLGCLFEAWIGALFLDFNQTDSAVLNACKTSFVTGPGYQIAQIFIESVFEKHVDWQHLISTDDNYKNILQVRIQKQFKITPTYLELETDLEEGYNMGVFLCLGKPIYQWAVSDAVHIQDVGNLNDVAQELVRRKTMLVKLGSSAHRIKKKAEQQACQNALTLLDRLKSAVPTSDSAPPIPT